VIVAAMREDRDAVLQRQRGGDIVLRRQRVAGAHHHLGAARGQHPRQVRRLGGDMQAGSDANTVELALAAEAIDQRPQHRHFGQRPLNPVGARVGERGVLDVVGYRIHQCLQGIAAGIRFLLSRVPRDPSTAGAIEEPPNKNTAWRSREA
jgi:hypothetical protein